MISGAEVASRWGGIIAPRGAIESVTLGSRLTRETGYTSVTYSKVQRVPATDEQLMMIGASASDTYITFVLYQISETTDPKIGDKITDSESIVWQVKKVEIKMMQKVFRCFCLKNKA